MRWHKDKHVDDDELHHLAEAEEWKNLDEQFPDFAANSRNMRLGMATNDFNPFGHMSQSYIDELKELWTNVVQTYDASTGKNFTMRACIFWTIHDFPAYGMMSGWSTKGYLACPICNENNSSVSLRSKIEYLGARRWLPENHIWRRNKLFNSKFKDRTRPLELSGQEILEQINSGTYEPFGKHPSESKKRKRDKFEKNLNWGKKSILFGLPYFEFLNLRWNLDVMHIGKNICENLLGTFLGINGKNKDMEKARKDLEAQKLHKELHLKRHANGSFEKPLAILLRVLKKLVGNKAHPKGSIVEAYVSKECTTFCSMYLDVIETVFNRQERNDDGGELEPGLRAFTQQIRPFSIIPRAPDVPVNQRHMAHWIHKNLLGNGNTLDIAKRQCKKFPQWFKGHVNELRKQRSPEATNELWSLANKLDPMINTYSGCIFNGVHFHSIEWDNQHTSQNSGVVVEGEHEGQTINYYGYDPFGFPSQVELEFYIVDTKLGEHWKVVERIQRRGIWNVPEMDSFETSGSPNEVFQQEITTEVPTIVVEDPPIVSSLQINDIEPAIISEEEDHSDEDEEDLMGDLDDEEDEENYSDSGDDFDIEA
ncbi:uncharacterized protein LOC131302909 [Rhododendron vialii]|uniref:uncharacterized protein LOC131302909 n=1 Tax=Rhododendron vialii TaxID=182163 RepID=UPI00265F1A6E|nr:uncharacterized protein LOC131302909 [Rhododendron vialii]